MAMRINVTPGDVRELLVSLGRITVKDKIIGGELTDTETQAITGLFEPWIPGSPVVVNDLRTSNGKLYKCVQAHATQSDWRPENTPALWVVVAAPGVIADWVQPGSTNPYMIGDKVVFNGHIWESKINDNVWSPASYPAGWTDLGAV